MVRACEAVVSALTAGEHPPSASPATAASAAAQTAARKPRCPAVPRRGNRRVPRLPRITLRRHRAVPPRAAAAPRRRAARAVPPPPPLSRRLASMAGMTPADEIAALSSKLASIEAVLDPDAMRKEAAALREQAADPGLWADQAHAQQVTRRLSYLEAELNRLSGLRQRLADTRVLFDLAESEHDEPTRDEAAR